MQAGIMVASMMSRWVRRASVIVVASGRNPHCLEWASRWEEKAPIPTGKSKHGGGQVGGAAMSCQWLTEIVLFSFHPEEELEWGCFRLWSTQTTD